MEAFSRIVKEYVIIEGACAAGIATVDTLAGGPPSADLTYVLPGARAAVSFAVAMDQQVIPDYLRKRDRLSLERELIRVNALASGIGLHLEKYLSQKGYPSVAVAANNVFRPPPGGGLPAYTADLYYPDISHRYLAVRCGVASMGLSGNVLTADAGAAIILGAAVTTAPLVPTEPLPVEDNYCDHCKLCMAACVSGFMDSEKKTAVSLGGHAVSYSRRRNLGRCDCVCSGFTGLHASGKWSTWSPGRFAIPAEDAAIPAAYARMQAAHGKWPPSEGGRYFYFTDDKLRVSCANCQLVCCPDKNERKARFKMLTGAGVVVQHPDGRREAMPPEAGEAFLSDMPPERRALYEDF